MSTACVDAVLGEFLQNGHSLSLHLMHISSLLLPTANVNIEAEFDCPW